MCRRAPKKTTKERNIVRTTLQEMFVPAASLQLVRIPHAGLFFFFRAPGDVRDFTNIQALSAFLDAYYCTVPLRDIFNKVREYMIQKQVKMVLSFVQNPPWVLFTIDAVRFDHCSFWV